MGALGGLFNFGGAPAEQSWLRAMGAQLRRLGPGDETVATAGPAGLVFRTFGTAPQEKEQSWLWQSSHDDWLAFDGRLDNGPALARKYGLTGDAARSDGAILLEGFARQKTAFLAEIVGDFALAYWDAAARTMTLGRDVAGIRTLYYHLGSKSFAFASDIGSLLNAARVDRELDEDHIAAYLGSGGTDPHGTIYRHIRAVEPAQVVSVSSDGVLSSREYWHLPFDADLLDYKNDRDYEDEFRSTVLEAVRVRLRTPYPIVSELSGGLDSSTMVCIADHLMRTGTDQVLSTLSRVCDISSTSDETKFRTAVEQHIGRPACLIRESEFPVYTPAHNAKHLHVLGMLPLKAGWENRATEYMQAEGAHVLLSGVGGDEMFISTNNPVGGLADLWRAGHLRELHRQALVWSLALRQPYTTLLWKSLKMSVPRRWLPNALNPDLRARRVPLWIHPRLRRQALDGNTSERVRVRRYRWPTHRDHVAGFNSVSRSISHGDRQEFAPRQITYPWMDRPLLEFMYRVPFWQKLRVGESRSLQRRALRDILPPILLARRGKGISGEGAARALRLGTVDWQALLRNPIMAERQYVDAEMIDRLFVRASTGIATEQEIFPMRALGLEAWLRLHDPRGQRDDMAVLNSDPRQEPAGLFG